LLTNDGELAHRVTHPSYGVAKTYLAEVVGEMPRGLGATLRAGIELEDGPASVDSFKVVGRSGSRIMVELVIHEGRNHIVRRMLAAVDHPVQRLVRTAVGPIQLADLRPGKTRSLQQAELGALFKDVGL
jgi:23S rRNA pseudouridine2605 synthase